MQTDNLTNSGPKPGFFDDDDISIGFPFVTPSQSHEKDLSTSPIFSSKLFKQISPSEPKQVGYYALYGRTLAYFKTMQSNYPERVLCLHNAKAKMSEANFTSTDFGFSLSKNGITYDFFSEDEKIIQDWMSVLKNVCVLTQFHEEYKALKMIGKGSFAKVYMVESKTTGKNFAVKAFTKEGIILSNQANAKPAMINEIDLMRCIDHENIIKLYEVYETERSIYLVMELVQGKALQDLLKKSKFKDSEPRIVNVISSLLSALEHLAAKGIMHRDLKPDNILIDKSDKVKIVDFGLATAIDIPEYIFKKCGTPGYIAPEVFKFDPKNPQTRYDGRCDVFSIGCILFYMLFGFLFFDGSNASEILKTNRKFNPDFQTLKAIQDELKSPNSKISKDALDLLVKLLEFNPKDRYTASQGLSHPFLYSVTQQKLAGSYDVYQNGGYSPAFDKRNSFVQEHIKNDSFASPQRYAEKDSLYLDVGRPDFTGKIDTITNGSANNSLLLTRDSSTPLTPNSGSSNFAKTSKQSSSFKAQAGNQSFLKAAIFRNMQKNNEEEEAKEEAFSPNKGKNDAKAERRYSDFVTTKSNPFGRMSDVNEGDDMKEHPQVNPQVGKVKNHSTLVENPARRSSHHSQYQHDKGI